MYTCLFAREGHDLRTALRDGASDDALEAMIAAHWSQREDRYSEQRAQLRASGDGKKVEMFTVGG
jgi:cyclic pyranopterin phosphate synthase